MMKPGLSPLRASLLCLPLLLAGACAKESDPGGGSGGSGAGARGGSSAGRGGTTGGSNTGTGGSNTGTGGAGSGTGGAGSGTGGSGAGGTGTGTGGAGSGTGGTGSGSDAAGGSGTGGAGSGTGGSGASVPTPAAMARPFPAHTTYKASAKPMGTPDQLDGAVRTFYNQWKQAYLAQGCGGWYVKPGVVHGTTGAVMTISEAHGYGMLAVAMMHGHDQQARAIFDGLHTYAKAFPSINQTGLMAWVIMEGCKMSTAATGNMVPDSAADGDLDMAYAYLLAHHQWGSGGAINYFAEAMKLITALKDHEINRQTNLIMLGDWADVNAPYYNMRYKTGFTGPYGSTTRPHADYYWGTRSSDFMLGHFRAFGSVPGGDAKWKNEILNAHYALIAKIQGVSRSGLMSDFIENTNTDAKPAMPRYLEWDNDDKHAFNACRFPWRLGTEYVISGDARAKTALDKINGWLRPLTMSNPNNIKAGYRLDGSTTPGADYYEMAFVAPFGVAAMADTANPAWVDAIWKSIVGRPIESYYGDSIKLLSMLVMSGNWWTPFE